MAIRNVPRTVWALGFVSLFMDVSTEMIQCLLPVFLVVTLGASPALLGVIEGIAEGTSSITRLFSGWLSDRFGARKGLAIVGYGLAALTKPVFPLAVTPYEVLAARFVDRIGKGVRGAPRDALIADVTPAELRGAAFGLRQSLDTVGAFLGPLLAVGLMALLHDSVRKVFGYAVIPAVIAVLLLAFGVREPRASRRAQAGRPPVRRAELIQMGAPYWMALAVGVLFTLARFSEAFLVLRGVGAGIPLTFIPFVLIVMNLVYSLCSAPLGGLSDRIGRKPVLAGGLVALAAADLVLALRSDVLGVMLGVGLWGLHMGASQGQLAALVADTAPERLRGAAFGLFSFAGGVMLLAASVLAGALWSAAGAPATFLVGGGFATAAFAGLILLIRERR